MDMVRKQWLRKGKIILKILYMTDLHGSMWKYNKLIDIAQTNKIEMIINGGDMLPKNCDLFSQKDFIINYLVNHFKIFNDLNIYYLCFLGNDDLKIFDDLFERICNKYPYIIPIAQNKFKLNNYEFIGFNLVSDYPFRLKDRCRMDMKNYIFEKQLGTALLSTSNGYKEINDWISYANSLPTIEEELKKLVTPNDMNNCIYIIHMPPSDLNLDKCYNNRMVGSKAIYNFLEKNQPLISLHGHIHESPEVGGKWISKLNKTFCIQPGQNKDFIYVIIYLENMEFKRNILKEGD